MQLAWFTFFISVTKAYGMGGWKFRTLFVFHLSSNTEYPVYIYPECTRLGLCLTCYI